MTLGNQFKLKREELGKTQREMSKLLDIGIMQYNRIEKDHSTPSYKVLQKFADKFHSVIHVHPSVIKK